MNNFPSLAKAKMIAVDIETRDDELREKGPGVRRDGYIVGVAIATPDGFSTYLPVRHAAGKNLSPSKVFDWLRKELKRPNQPKVGTNLTYDFDYLAAEGIDVAGSWYDISVAEALINENRGEGYSLDALSKRYLGHGKQTDVLKQKCTELGLKGDPRQHIWKLSAQFVAEYARGDVVQPLLILEQQLKVLTAEETIDLFEMESYLSRVLLSMRQRGVRVDTDVLEKTIRKMKRRLTASHKELNRQAGMVVDVWAAKSIAKAFDAAGIPYGRTAKQGNPSFTKESLEATDHPLAQAVHECRAIEKFINTFLIGQIQEQIIGDRIHPVFNQTKSDEYGTVTGRLSGSNPNMQFMPARDSELGPICRSLFIPEEDCWWGKCDYSQVEYRIASHYATGPGADAFREQYCTNPDIDFHQWVADISGLDRRTAKNLNFGMLYGMGITTYCKKFGVDKDEAQRVLTIYHKAMPFIRETANAVANRAAQRGWVRTILNRRRRFEMWEPIEPLLVKSIGRYGDKAKLMEAINAVVEDVSKKHGISALRRGVRRAGTHKALNAIIQGSAAELMKKALVDSHKAGLFDMIPAHITVHDELGNSVPKTKRGKQAWEELQHIMTTCVKFKVPIRVDAALQINWGTKEKS